MKEEIEISLVEDVFGLRKFEIAYIKIRFFVLEYYQIVFCRDT